MKKVFEILSMIALLIWGSVFIYFYFSGRIDNYLTSSFRIWAPIAGGGMIALGVLNLINLNRDTGACSHDHAHGDHSSCDHDHHDHDHKHDESCDHEHHHHDHDHGEGHDHNHEEATASSLAFALIVLLVPVLTAAKYSNDSFSGDYMKKWVEIEDDMRKLRQKKLGEAQQIAAGENPYTNPDDPKTEDKSSGGEAWGEFTLEDLKKMVPQTSKGDFLLDVPQIYYTAGDQELMKVMEGITVETTAQVIEDTVDNSPENRLRAYRLMIECCAADARPLSIPIDFTESLPEYKEMGWYKLIGRLHFDKSADHEYVPLLQIKSFEQTPEPADWMVY